MKDLEAKKLLLEKQEAQLIEAQKIVEPKSSGAANDKKAAEIEK